MNEEQMRCSSHTLNAKLPQVSRLVSLKIFVHLKLGFYKSQVEKDYIQPIKVKPLSVRSGNCWTR
jgi:hypothetical protein